MGIFSLTTGGLQAVAGESPFHTHHVEIVPAQNFQICELIAETQLVIGLKLTAVAASADTFQVFGAVRIAQAQPPDEPGRYDVIHMAPHASLSEIRAAPGLAFCS